MSFFQGPDFVFCYLLSENLHQLFFPPHDNLNKEKGGDAGEDEQVAEDEEHVVEEGPQAPPG